MSDTDFDGLNDGDEITANCDPLDMDADDDSYIDSDDNSLGCTVNYGIVLGKWGGDDNDGITNGSYDGSQSSDEDDAYVEYSISTI